MVQLGILPTSIKDTTDFAGFPHNIRMTLVNISFNGRSFKGIKVGLVDRTNACIGRDILNRLKLELDGPNLEYEIE